ncbi:putative pre-16S rRNA nuclease [Cohnella xylanilytica]|uniref:Putative pre-16S rRNA nuclease n=1 Tax=Cohnella xylanilytica TaxID=557555 RepID=A0A841U7D4_9BACL|nr:Holliday junction resolvase RuvX [Cohnella xylanilytica]MBB6693931.1 Holliday junction resolvase RuvX [Cohnella xylanilytica]GIO13614.1 putative pre-16S rRNA nuclease [Cohnella xylanilytica]
MRVMGLDYGDKRIGVALSDAFGWTAQGAEVIERKKEGDYLERIRELVRVHEVDTIVVGLPKNMNGTIGPRGEICMAFAEELRQTLSMPVHLWDERLTTVAAERTLLEADVSRRKRKQVVDKMAAAILLQNYLDSRQK